MTAPSTKPPRGRNTPLHPHDAFFTVAAAANADFTVVSDQSGGLDVTLYHDDPAMAEALELLLGLALAAEPETAEVAS